MSNAQRHNQLEKLLSDAYELLSDLDKSLLVESNPLERKKLQLGIDNTKAHIEKYQAELGQLPLLVEVELRYLQRVIDTFEKQLFDYIELDSTVRIDKTDLNKAGLIDLTCLHYAPTVPKEQSRFAKLDEKSSTTGFGTKPKEEVIEGTLFEQVAAVARGAVLGAPGGGKTTSFRQLAVYYARQAQKETSPTDIKDFHQGKIPVLIPLGSYKPSRQQPFTFIQEFLRRGAQGYPAAPELADRLNTYLQNGKLLILLDAINEVAEEERQKAFNDLAEFAVVQAESGNSIFFSCREKDYLQNLVDLPRLELKELDNAHIRRFLDYHFNDNATIVEIENKLDANKGQLRTLVRNPYMLRVLLNVYRQNQGQLPGTRGELLRQFGRNMLSRALLKPEFHKWLPRLLPEQELSDQIFSHLTESYQKLVVERLAVVAEPLLGQLAFQMLLTPEHGTRISIAKIEEILPEWVKQTFTYRARRLGPSQLYQLELERWEGVELGVEAGLLRLTEYADQPEFIMLEFSHQLLEEYFTASYLRAMSPDSEEWNIAANYYNFDEVFPLLADLYSQPDEVIKLVWKYDFELAWRCASLLPEYSLSQDSYNWLITGLLTVLKQGFRVDWKKALEGLTMLKATQPLFMISTKHNDIDTRLVAAEALGKLGAKEAIPALIALLQDSDSNIRLRAVEALEKLGAKEQTIPALIALLQDSDNYIRSRAVEALGKLRAKEQAVSTLRDIRKAIKVLEKLEAKEAIPVLIALLQDSNIDVRFVAVSILEKLEAKEAIPALIALLQDSDSNIRRRAVEALEKLGAKEAIPAFIALLQDSDSNIRRRAVEALEKLGAKEQTISAFIALLQDSDSNIRLRAVEALEKLGAKEQTIPALIALLQDSDSNIRRRAVEALEKLGAKEAIPVFITLLQDSDNYIRRQAAEALEKLGAKEAIPAFIALLHDRDINIRRRAVEILEKLGAKEAIPAFITLLQNSDNYIRRRAVEALEKLGAKEQTIPIFITLLQDSDIDIRRQAAEVLKKLEAKEAIPVFITLLQDSDITIRLRAAEALEKLGVKEQIVPAFITLLQDGDTNMSPFSLDSAEQGVRFRAAAALERLGAKEAIPALIALLQSSDIDIRRQAAEVLKKLEAKEAIPVFITLLQDSDNYIRRQAAEALEKLGAKEAIPAFIALLHDRDINIRLRAVETLEKLGAKEAIPALIMLLQDGDIDVRLQAAEALEKLGATEQAVPAVIALLQDNNITIRRRAAQTLEKLGDRNAVMELLPLIKHKDENIREDAYKIREYLKRKLHLPKDL